MKTFAVNQLDKLYLLVCGKMQHSYTMFCHLEVIRTFILTCIDTIER